MNSFAMKTPIIIFLLCFSLNVTAQCFYQVKELDPKNFNQDFSAYDQRTALYLGQLSDLAYSSDNTEIRRFVDYLNQLYKDDFITVDFVEDKKKDGQALLWCTKNFLVVAFRGTEPKRKDFSTDLKFFNYKNNPSDSILLKNMPKGHGGFRSSLINLIRNEKLTEKMESLVMNSNPNIDYKTFPIYTTGHSLGAALSQLFIECIASDQNNFAGAYHFAPPLAVHCSQNEYMKKMYEQKVYDIINYKDYVPRAGRNGVAHFGQFYRICKDSLLYKEPEAYVKFTFKEKMKLSSMLDYHSLNSHLAALRLTSNSNEKVLINSKNPGFPCMGEGITEQKPCK